MEVRTDRVGLLVEQLSESKEFSRDRMEGLTDDEYLWEPVPNMWSVRPRAEVSSSQAHGPGDWQIDNERIDPFAPGPTTTIGWRLNHLLSGLEGRWEWTFGSRSVPPENVVDFSPRAAVALDRLWDVVGRWIEGVESLSDTDLDTPGYGQYPWGLDPELPFIGIVRWTNREFIHHTAEAALLRDLYAARFDP